MEKKRVLVIDDEKLMVKSTCRALEMYQFETIGALDGESGLKAAQSEKPDIILLDIMMPVVDGWHVLERLKRHEDTAHIPVIIFTAKEYSDGVKIAREHGAVDFITKPFDLDEIVEMLQSYLIME